MSKSDFDEEEFGSLVPEDKSDTVYTGYNTDDPVEPFDRVLEDEELKSVGSFKSLGREVKMPEYDQKKSEGSELHPIEEGSNFSDEIEIELSPEKRLKTTVVSPQGDGGVFSDVVIPKTPHKKKVSLIRKLKPIERNSKAELQWLLTDSSKQKVMRSGTLRAAQKIKSQESRIGSEVLDELPDPIESKGVKLTKRQKAVENELKIAIRSSWPKIFEKCVVRKRRRVILSKDEFSIDYNIKNKRELLLPPEYYLNLTL